MPSADENMRLLWLILSQKLVDGQVAGIDWNLVASGLNLEKSTAASLRWSRLKKELLENGLPPPPTGDNEAKPAKKARTPRAKNPKEKAAKEEGVKDHKPKKITKKRKLDVEEETTGDAGAENVKSEEELSDVDSAKLEGIELEEA